jgi:4-amino-4-deoxy-L-arabinose transferase-like glycosyltransferase
MTASIALAAGAFVNGFRLAHAAGFALALGLAQLAKGPVGLAVPLLVLALAALLSRSARVRPARLLVGSAAVSVVVFLAWAVPANAATHGRLFTEGFGRHVVGRSLAPMEGHGGGSLAGLGYYLPVVAFGFLPGLLYLPAALSAAFGKRLGERTSALLLAWIAAPLVLFTLVATKLPHYVLPIWPALALLCGGLLDAATEGRLAARDRACLRWGVLAYGAVTIGAVVLYLVAPARIPVPGLRIPGLALAVLAAVSSALGLAATSRGRHGRGVAVLAAGAAAMAAAAALLLMPAVERVKPVPPIAAAIRARVGPEAPLATLGFEEPSLTFASGARSVRHLATAAEAGAWMREGGAGVLVLPRVELSRLKSVGALPPPEEIASASGWNVANGRRVDLVAVLRR